MNKKSKIIILVSLLLITSLLLIACDGTLEEIMSMESIIKEPNFEGIIEEINDNSLLIKTEDSKVSSDLISVLLSSKLKEIYNPNYKIGDEVVVYYDGSIAESYPAQVQSHVVLVKELDKLEDNFVNKFAYKTAAEILKDNSSYSPLSLHLALSLATTGSDGETNTELTDLLGLSEDKINENIEKLLTKLQHEGKDSKLLIANSLWMQKNIDGQEIMFDENFIKNAEKHFNAEMFLIDFNTARAGKEMSKWISDKTNKLLEPEIETKEGQIASIMNTIYFKDKWISPFESTLTKVDKFTKEDLSQVELDFMHQSIHSKYYKSDDWTKSNLLFDNGGEMFFVLPNENVSLKDLLTEENLSSILENDNGNIEEVNWSLPKFTADSEFELIPMLKKLGVETPFTSKANFSKMVNNADIHISSIQQGNKIIVEEGGVEAAAYTNISFNLMSAVIEEPVDFKLDKPFLYGITSEDGTLLFIGVYQGE